MSDRKGYENRYYLNTGTYESKSWVEISQAADTEAARNAEMYENTKKKHAASNNKSYVAGIQDRTWTINVFVDPTDTAYDALDDAHKDGTTVEVLRVEGGVISTDGLDAECMICHVFNGAESEPVAGLATQVFELRFADNSDTDGPEDGTTADSDFVASS